jgi:hypothetical protein
MLENRGTMERRQQPVAASGASAPVASPPVFSLFIVHYSLFIAENSLNFNPTRRHCCARNPQKPAKMTPMMVNLVPVKYRLRPAKYRFSTGYDQLSTGKVPVMVSYGRLRKLPGLLRSSNDVLSTKASPVLSEF